MTFAELVDRVSKQTGFPREETRVICEEFVKAILHFLFVGEEVRIKRLGSFVWKELKARRMKHPVTKEEYEAPARLRLLFRASLDLRKGLRRVP